VHFPTPWGKTHIRKRLERARRDQQRTSCRWRPVPKSARRPCKLPLQWPAPCTASYSLAQFQLSHTMSYLNRPFLVNRKRNLWSRPCRRAAFRRDGPLNRSPWPSFKQTDRTRFAPILAQLNGNRPTPLFRVLCNIRFHSGFPETKLHGQVGKGNP
jgi:hypothetical protein